MRSVYEARNELAKNGIEVTPEEAGEMIKVAQRMKKMSKKSQFELFDLVDKAKKEFPGNQEQIEIVVEHLMEMK